MSQAKDAVKLTRYLVSLPPAPTTVLLLLLFSFGFGMISHLAAAGKIGAYELIDAGGKGIFLLAIPALLTAVLLFFIRRTLLFKRLVFLAFVGALAYAVFYLAANVLKAQGIGIAPYLVFVGFGMIFAIWFLIARVVFGLHKVAFVFALLQLVFNAAFFLATRYVELGADPFSIMLKIYFACFVFLVGLYAIFWLINAPMKRNFGMSSVDVAEMFMGQWFYQKSDLEEAFQEIGEEAETLVGVISFKNNNKETLFVVPYVHFGPFGNLGGSEFSHLIAERLSKETGAEVFVFHGTATHDLNPVASSEIDKVLAACRACLHGMKREPGKCSFATAKAGGSHALCMKLNDSAFVGLSRAPLTTEDVGFGVGFSILNALRGKVREALVVDEHNAETGDITTVEAGSEIAFEMLDASMAALSKCGKQGQMLFGSACCYPKIGTFGSGGIKIAAIRCDAKLHAILLFDSNGITPDFRHELLELLARKGIDAEIFTTDTHQTNSVRGVLNPVGKGDRKEVREALLACLDSALGKMGRVSCGAATKRFKINVLGPKQSAEIISTVNSIVAVAKIAVPIILIGTVMAILWGVSRF